MSSSCSVIRFDKLLPLWQNIQSLGQFFRGYVLLCKILDLLWQILCAIGQIFFYQNGQMLKNNLAIWSHCHRGPILQNVFAVTNWQFLYGDVLLSYLIYIVTCLLSFMPMLLDLIIGMTCTSIQTNDPLIMSFLP